MPQRCFRLITLDLEDTVWPCKLVIRAAEEAVLDWLTVRAQRLAALHDRQSLREHCLRLMAQRLEIAHDLALVRQLSIASLLEDLGYPPDLAGQLGEQSLAVFMVHCNHIEPYPDAAPVLRRLAVDYQLVSITNDNADQELTLLAGLFHYHITAARAGAAKLDPVVFDLALRLTGTGPWECLHVGDEPYLNVEAARCLGIEAIWINRLGRTWSDDLAPPTVTITDLHQLAAWLGIPGGGKQSADDA